MGKTKLLLLISVIVLVSAIALTSLAVAGSALD